MEQQSCRVCGKENPEGEIECKRCHWPISADSPDDREEKRLKCVQNIWKSHSKIQQELEHLKRQNTNYSNFSSSALENSLQSLVGHQLSQISLLQEQNNYLKKLSSEVTYIKEQLPSNYSDFKQAQNQESVSTEEGLYSQLSEEDTNLDSPPSISNSDSNLLSAYNLDSRSLSTRTITVSESDYTAEQRRLGRSVSPILKLNSRGSYWILKEGNNEYLFPKANLKINEHNYNTIATFFECVGYQPGALNNFTVVKLAKVSSIDERWELRETGQLNFYQ